MDPRNRRRLINRLRRRGFDNYFKAVAALNYWMPFQKEARRRCRIIRDVPYRATGSPHHRLDIFQPREAAGPLPILMYIHGGGFTICSKETHKPVAMAYSARGLLVFNVNYRLAPRYRFPAALEDVCRAYRWVVENAPAYGGDTSRLVLAGESAGANLVLGLIIAGTYRRPEPMAAEVWETGVVPRAAQLLCGLLQVSDPDRLQPQPPARRWMWQMVERGILRDIATAYLGAPYPDTPAGCELADPLKVIESDALPDRPLPAIFAMAGMADVVLDDTRRLEAALRRRNAAFTIKYYPNEGHAFHFSHWKKAAREFRVDSRRFFREHLDRASPAPGGAG